MKTNQKFIMLILALTTVAVLSSFQKKNDLKNQQSNITLNELADQKNSEFSCPWRDARPIQRNVLCWAFDSEGNYVEYVDTWEECVPTAFPWGCEMSSLPGNCYQH